MKNLFSNFGTKKVAGTLLVGATLLVGIGVINNFSGDSQKSANEVALARFGNSTYNSTVGGGDSSASRADLERRIAAGQDGYSARFLKGKSEGYDQDEAFSSDGAYAEGIRGGAGASYGADASYGPDGSAYQAFGSTYQQVAGEGEYDNAQGNAGFGERQFQAVQQAAAEAAGQGVKDKTGNTGKDGKGGARAGNRGVRPSTQINKLAASNGGSSFGSGGAGGGSFGGGSASFDGSNVKGGDNNTRALPQPQADAGQAGGNAFKFGRVGGMGGFNVGRNGGSELRGSESKGRGAANDLYMAKMYSNKAAVTREDVGQKSLAEAAFDGSNPEDLAPTIPEGATIGQVASELSKGLDINLPNPGSPNVDPDENDGPSLEDYIEQEVALKALQEKINNKILWMIGTVAAMAIALFFLVKAAYAAPLAWWFWAAAGALSLIALGTIALFMSAGDNSIVNMIKEMGDPEKFGLVNEGIDIGGRLTQVNITAASLTVLLGMCWIPWNTVSSLTGFWANVLQQALGTTVAAVGGKVVSQAKTEINIKKQNKG